MNKNEFINEVNKLGIIINEKQLNQLKKYYNLIIEWNNKINLTAITEEKDVYLKHFYDSLTITKVIDLNNYHSLCDVGTGAGFPGIVLKIIFPNLKITLIDSLQKRIKFLNNVIDELGLKDIETIHSRIEDYAINNKEKFDIVTSRAVAQLNVLSEYCIPIVKVNGYFIPMKGNITDEIEKSKNALDKLNGEIIEINNFKLPFEESNRSIIKIRKTNKTSKLFPRKYNEIKKSPL